MVQAPPFPWSPHDGKLVPGANNSQRRSDSGKPSPHRLENETTPTFPTSARETKRLIDLLQCTCSLGKVFLPYKKIQEENSHHWSSLKRNMSHKPHLPPSHPVPRPKGKMFQLVHIWMCIKKSDCKLNADQWHLKTKILSETGARTSWSPEPWGCHWVLYLVLFLYWYFLSYL